MPWDDGSPAAEDGAEGKTVGALELPFIPEGRYTLCQILGKPEGDGGVLRDLKLPTGA